MNSKVKDWMPPHVIMDFMDHKKQKHLVVVLDLPMGVAHYNTTSMDIAVGSTQDEFADRNYLVQHHDGCDEAVVSVPRYMACR